MKILTFGDIHVGVRTYGKIDPETSLNTREIQTLIIFDEMIDYAINNNIPVIVFAGDMYKNNIPTPTLQDEVNIRIKRAADSGIKFLLLDGNHDVSRLSTAVSAINVFDTLNVDNVIHTRHHKEYLFNDSDGNKIKFVFLPTYHTKDEINDIVDKTVYDGTPIVFIGHMTVKGAALNDWLIEDKEIYIDKDIFNKEGICAVILGHLHKHQILNRKPLIYYTGSTQRVDFNEENQPKGFVVLDIDNNGNVEHKFVEVQSQKFFTAKFNFNEETNATGIIKTYLENNEKEIENAIVRVKVELDELTKINEKEIYNLLNDFKSSFILPIQKTYNFNKTSRNAELTENISIEKGLEIYYKDKPRSKERIKLGKQIIKELKNI